MYAAVGLASACSTAPSIDSCADALAGVWVADTRAPSGERMRFHLTERHDRVHLVPMFDDAWPPTGDKHSASLMYAPASIELRRVGGALVGKRSRRVERDGHICWLVEAASIRACQGKALELSWEESAHIDWETCGTMSAPRRTRVQLIRERATW